MRSSTGAHYIALDHVRALAAFFVFAWHFTHVTVPLSYVPALIPFSILDEGHTGVALFMTLSGYLFAKLLDGRRIDYRAFLWNRAIRLLPLLVVVVAIVGLTKLINGEGLAAYALATAQGLFLPTLPNGGWSITVEFHYYIILPALLGMSARSKFLPLSIIVAAVGLRWFLHHERGEIQSLAYWTIVGRIDQFVLGMLAYQFRRLIARRHWVALAVIASFMIVYWRFNALGGFYHYPSYPSPRPFWIILPTIEGFAYAISIAWYDNSFSHSTSRLSRWIGRIGEYSYSIYLLHFFVVHAMARFVNEHVMNLSNFYVACLWAVACFGLMIIPAYFSFRFIESPFLNLRKRYVKLSPVEEESSSGGKAAPDAAENERGVSSRRAA